MQGEKFPLSGGCAPRSQPTGRGQIAAPRTASPRLGRLRSSLGADRQSRARSAVRHAGEASPPIWPAPHGFVACFSSPPTPHPPPRPAFPAAARSCCARAARPPRSARESRSRPPRVAQTLPKRYLPSLGRIASTQVRRSGRNAGARIPARPKSPTPACPRAGARAFWGHRAARIASIARLAIIDCIVAHRPSCWGPAPPSARPRGSPADPPGPRPGEWAEADGPRRPGTSSSRPRVHLRGHAAARRLARRPPPPRSPPRGVSPVHLASPLSPPTDRSLLDVRPQVAAPPGRLSPGLPALAGARPPCRLPETRTMRSGATPSWRIRASDSGFF